MKKLVMIGLLACVSLLPAQTLLTPTASDAQSPYIVFTNPAAAALIGMRQALVGMQMYHMGLGEDLRSNYGSYIQPLGRAYGAGVRLRYFSGGALDQGQFSLMLSRRLLGDRLAIGIDVNALSLSYDKSKFQLFDMNDPLLRDGTSIVRISYGFGLLMRPTRSFAVGLSVDHLNRPSQSLQSGYRKTPRLQIGATWQTPLLTPQIEWWREDEEAFAQFAVTRSLLQNRLQVFAAYQSTASGGSGVLAQVRFHIGDLGLAYSLHNPMSTDYSLVAGGSHEMSLCYTRHSPANITLQLEKLGITQFLPAAILRGHIKSDEDLKKIEIARNDTMLYTLACPPGSRTFNLQQSLEFVRNDNRFQVAAFTATNRVSEKFDLSFVPRPPQIKIISQTDQLVTTERADLIYSISDPIGVDSLVILLNDKRIVAQSRLGDANQINDRISMQLVQGWNTILIRAQNRFERAQHVFYLVYQHPDQPPALVLDSPDRPVSGGSSVMVHLLLDTVTPIDRILLRVNDKYVDTVRVARQTKLITWDSSRVKIRDAAADAKEPEDIHQYKENQLRGAGGVLVFAKAEKPAMQFAADTARQVQLAGCENHIEAIAMNPAGMAVTASTMNIKYNPYDSEMAYGRKRALVVGINRYQDPLIMPLNAARTDAQKMADILGNDFGFDVEHYHDEHATYENIWRFIANELTTAEENDFILVYFAGHGQTDTHGHGYLLPWDADRAPDEISRKIGTTDINLRARQSRARSVLLIYDACFAGTGIEVRPRITYVQQDTSVNYEILRNTCVSQARVIITAGDMDQKVKDELFTDILVAGLRGNADFNHDGYVTSIELGLYVQKHVPERAKEWGIVQTPQFGAASGVEGQAVFKVRYSR